MNKQYFVRKIWDTIHYITLLYPNITIHYTYCIVPTLVWASCRVVWVLRVRAVRSLRFLAGCGAEVRVGGGRMGVQAGLWSVGNGWLPVEGAC